MRRITTVSLIILAVAVFSFKAMDGFRRYINRQNEITTEKYIKLGDEVMSFFDHNKEPPSCKNAQLVLDKASEAYGYFEKASFHGDVGIRLLDAKEKMDYGQSIKLECEEIAREEKINEKIEKNFLRPIEKYDRNINRLVNAIRKRK